MDTADLKRNSISDSKPVARRPFNPRSRHLSKALSMIEPTNFEFEFQRQVPIIDARPVSNFTNKDEYVEAMVEDLCDWFNFLYNLENEDQMTPLTFFLQLQDGVILNKHAGVVQYLAESYLKSEKIISRSLPLKIGNQTMKVPNNSPTYVNVDFTKKINSFHKRDNISNFIHWCRNFNIPPGLTFETDDLILLKNPRNVVVCLLEIARIGGLFGIEVPDIIQLDEEINNEIVNETNLKNATQHLDRDEDSLILDKTDNGKFLDTNVTLRKKTNLPRRSSYDKSLRGMQLNKSLTIDDNDIALSDLDYQYPGYFNYSTGKLDPTNTRIDNSDNESINSHGSQYTIPKYKTQRPVGRVKIYDCFDRTNFVREKKYREKCDMRSLDERVREILSECQCSETFPMKRISEGKYQWGDKKTLIFVRILRNHVMVRVGGGWDTLNNFLRKHDHCRKERQINPKHFPTPQIRKPLNPSVTCPSHFKFNLQGSYSQHHNSHNDNQGLNRRNGIMMHVPLGDPGVNETTLLNGHRSQGLVHSILSQNLKSDFKSPEDVESSEKSDNKENSSKRLQSMCPSESGSIANLPEVTLSDLSDKNQIIQSNQKLDKHISRIPVLKKR